MHFNSLSAKGKHHSVWNLFSHSTVAQCRPLSSSPLFQGSVPYEERDGCSSEDCTFHEPLNLVNSPYSDIVDIVSTMVQFPFFDTLQEQALYRLWIHSWDDDHASMIGFLGGMRVILSAMVRFPANTELIWNACECLRNLTAVHEHNRREILENSGIDLILQVMLCHPRDVNIQRSACASLVNIVSSRSSIFATAIVRAGGIAVLVSVTDMYSNKEDITQPAFEALRLLGYEQKGRVTPLPEDFSS